VKNKTNTNPRPSVASAGTLWVEKSTLQRLKRYAAPRGLKIRHCADHLINAALDIAERQELVTKWQAAFAK
jgi:hypothetical protein